MLSTRLNIALTDGALTLPQTGQIAVFGPERDADLSALPRDRCVIVTPDYPAHHAWQNRGWIVSPALPEGPFAAAIVCLPRAKPLAQAWISAASQATEGGLLVVDGQKHDGADSVLKALKKKVAPLGAISKAHGKLAWYEGVSAPEWAARDHRLPGDFITRPGVFSADGIDKGSAALIAALPETLKGRVADLGAGWGLLAHHALKCAAVEEIDLIEANATALDCARINAADPRANFIWTDATTYRSQTPYDVILSNPPFHTGRAGDPDLGRAFITTAAHILKGTGQFFMVANRHLPYEEHLKNVFREVTEIGGTPGFKVLRAAKPNTRSGRNPH